MDREKWPWVELLSQMEAWAAIDEQMSHADIDLYDLVENDYEELDNMSVS